MLRYGGESNVPGAPGNLFAGSPSFQIGPRSPFKGMSQEELNKLKEWDSRPGDLQKYYEQQNQPGPRLPFAGFPGAIGNMGGLLAQAQSPGAAIGANALGGGMGMNMEQMQRQMQGMQQQGGPPITFGVDIENEKVKNLRGAVNANLDANQAVRFGGNYNVQDQTGRLDLGYQTRMFGFDVGITRTPGVPTAGPGYGFEGNVRGRF
jgi:hypothetical protein